MTSSEQSPSAPDATSRDLADRLARAQEEVRRLSDALRRSLDEQRRLQLVVEDAGDDLKKKEREHLAVLGELRQREEEALRRGEERFRLILTSAGEGIYGLDRAGRVIFVNPVAARILGWQPAEMIGRSAHNLFHHSRPDGNPYPREECPMEASLRDGVARVAEEEFLWQRDGSCFPAECTTTPIYEGEELVGAVVVFRDITERKVLESHRHRVMRELEESLRARDDFLSIAAHELRTPLTSLQLHVDGILRATERDAKSLSVEQLAARLQQARGQLQRLNRLVEQLLDVSRITIGRLDLQLEEGDLAEISRDVATRARQELQRSGSRLTIDAERPVRGTWDLMRIDQVVTNLLSNAVKYGRGQPIEIAVSHKDGVARLIVRDHGIGIDREKIPRLFQRFERLVSVGHHAGFGLGLWIVNQIVDAHGGKIAVSSEPGRGSTFEVELPLRPPERRTEEPARR
ncbi:MAG TPA: ATP-binding protein [Thermoanaerobaculia bacterium]|nr:ATP-binding protein [Thermoanaerobaculia bacterium]